jgi:nitrogen regulatory protein P-II 1
MKKIEAIVLPSKEKDLIDALQKTGIGGLTVTSGRGRGKGVRRIKPGLGRYIDRFNDVLTFVIVVEDSMADEIVSIITEVAHTGSPGDGKIFISTIDEIVDIYTKQKGVEYI